MAIMPMFFRRNSPWLELQWTQLVLSTGLTFEKQNKETNRTNENANTAKHVPIICLNVDLTSNLLVTAQRKHTRSSPTAEKQRVSCPHEGG